jgi:hypothetical protein
MENLLLIWDEIDDLFSMVGAIWRPIASFALALAAFIATGFVYLYAPLTVAVVAAVLLLVGFAQELKDRRLRSVVPQLEANSPQ